MNIFAYSNLCHSVVPSPWQDMTGLNALPFDKDDNVNVLDTSITPANQTVWLRS